MQLRHLRYFVRIVEAGSFSRAAALVHVAQPALSQQIAELEDKLGVTLLQRSARGVRPTAAGEVLYKEASSILRQVEQLPGIVRSSGGDIQGTVGLGMSSTLAASFAGPIIETCRTALPKVVLKFSSLDSESLKGRIDAHTLDLAVVFEDEFVPRFSRKPIFRQRLYYVARGEARRNGAPMSLDDLARVPLVLPGLPNVTRSVVDRAFARAGLQPNIVVEADVLSSVLAAVGQGIGGTVLPRGDLSELSPDAMATPINADPPIALTASTIWSSDFPLTRAGEAVRSVVTELLDRQLRDVPAPGAEPWAIAGHEGQSQP